MSKDERQAGKLSGSESICPGKATGIGSVISQPYDVYRVIV